ncbi:protein naked cuticle homolog 2-like isoform X2 [Nylanderia fulva]|uniref:protein naked cuticle homolog 2-like isoform X2 n=1 Tax=Nylanderia fulva TaxID=613905 RepID=UPI0010FB0FBE|nr:protein naked cuticle homolog 2-like isoform X2 [Nylanderia fulva]
MATGLVKWWRARFLAGYRPFSVVGTNAEGSDSEELLTGIPTTCNVSSPPTTTESKPTLISPAEPPQVAVDGPSVPAAGPTGNDEQPTCGTTKQLSLEQVACKVSVTEDGDTLKEIAFTLYDFNGQGKITKDDIAGLVTTIYDKLGASTIQVPSCGSKIINVTLTVSPDQRTSSKQTPRNAPCIAAQTSQTTTTTLPTSAHQHNNPSSCCHLKHVAPCSHATTAATRHYASRVPRRRRATRYRCRDLHSSVYNTHKIERKEVETHSEDEDEKARANRVQQEELRKRVGPVPHLPSPYSNSSEGDVSDDSGDTSPAFSPLTPLLTMNQKKRSGALQRQQLLEIIQANMEKNNLSFHTSRKRHQNSEQPRNPSQSPNLGTSNHNNQDCQASPHQGATHYYYYSYKPIRESATHHSASFPKTPTKSRTANHRKTRHATPKNNATVHSSPQTTYSQLLNRNVSTVYNDTPQHTSNTTHRNIVNLVPNNNQQTANHQTTITNNHNNLQRNDAQFLHSQQCNRSKKHQLKHATREQDQARAMAQVVRWLEREFSQNVGGSRRHVHEHVHHHYHHHHYPYPPEALV